MKTIGKLVTVATLVLAAWFVPATSYASICGPCSMDSTALAYETTVANPWGCRADWAGFFNRGLGIHEVDFPGGWGWTDECNDWRPLKKIHNAMYLLYRSSSNPKFFTNDFSGTILDWGGNFVMRETYDLEGHCEAKEWNIAGSICMKGQVWADANESRGRIRMYRRSFGHNYGIQNYPRATVIERSSTLMHEAAHLYGKEHYQSTGKDPMWDSGGAWHFEVRWLAFYARDASVNTTTLMRGAAANAANVYISSGFIQKPNLYVQTTGVFFANNTSQMTRI